VAVIVKTEESMKKWSLDEEEDSDEESLAPPRADGDAAVKIDKVKEEVIKEVVLPPLKKEEVKEEEEELDPLDAYMTEVTKEVRKIKGASFKAAKGLVTKVHKDEKVQATNGESVEKKKGLFIMMGVAKKKPELNIKKPEVRRKHQNILYFNQQLMLSGVLHRKIHRHLSFVWRSMCQYFFCLPLDSLFSTQTPTHTLKHTHTHTHARTHTHPNIHTRTPHAPISQTSTMLARWTYQDLKHLWCALGWLKKMRFKSFYLQFIAITSFVFFVSFLCTPITYLPDNIIFLKKVSDWIRLV
jgi:hypothetical protein